MRVVCAVEQALRPVKAKTRSPVYVKATLEKAIECLSKRSLKYATTATMTCAFVLRARRTDAATVMLAGGDGGGARGIREEDIRQARATFELMETEGGNGLPANDADIKQAMKLVGRIASTPVIESFLAALIGRGQSVVHFPDFLDVLAQYVLAVSEGAEVVRVRACVRCLTGVNAQRQTALGGDQTGGGGDAAQLARQSADGHVRHGGPHVSQAPQPARHRTGRPRVRGTFVGYYEAEEQGWVRRLAGGGWCW